MKLLCTKKEFEQAKSTDYLPLQCKACEQTFQRRKSTVDSAVYYLIGLDDKARKTLDYCSPTCSGTNKRPPHFQEEKQCKECGVPYLADKASSQFCSPACQRKSLARIANKRSKAEVLLAELIRNDFPSLTLFLNDRDFLKCRLEIDIFLPEIGVAIEVNGPGHYKPIYGDKSLERTQRNDAKKKAELEKRGTTMIIMDISSPAHNRWKNSRKRIKSFYSNTLKGILQKAKKESQGG